MSERKQSIREYMLEQHRHSWSTLSALDQGDMSVAVYETPEQTWHVRDMLAHLADAESGLLAQARRISKGEQTLPEDFDIDRWNNSAVRRRSEASPGAHLAEIEASFQAALKFLEELDDVALDWTGRHSSGALLTLEEYFRRIVDHRVEHTMDIRRALRK